MNRSFCASPSTYIWNKRADGCMVDAQKSDVGTDLTLVEQVLANDTAQSYGNNWRKPAHPSRAKPKGASTAEPPNRQRVEIVSHLRSHVVIAMRMTSTAPAEMLHLSHLLQTYRPADPSGACQHLGTDDSLVFDNCFECRLECEDSEHRALEKTSEHEQHDRKADPLG